MLGQKAGIYIFHVIPFPPYWLSLPFPLKQGNIVTGKRKKEKEKICKQAKNKRGNKIVIFIFSQNTQVFTLSKLIGRKHEKMFHVHVLFFLWGGAGLYCRGENNFQTNQIYIIYPCLRLIISMRQLAFPWNLSLLQVGQAKFEKLNIKTLGIKLLLEGLKVGKTRTNLLCVVEISRRQVPVCFQRLASAPIISLCNQQ